jgi:hypothetical protein
MPQIHTQGFPHELPRSRSHNGPTNPRNKSQHTPKWNHNSRSKGLRQICLARTNVRSTLADGLSEPGGLSEPLGWTVHINGQRHLCWEPRSLALDKEVGPGPGGPIGWAFSESSVNGSQHRRGAAAHAVDPWPWLCQEPGHESRHRDSLCWELDVRLSARSGVGPDGVTPNRGFAESYMQLSVHCSQGDLLRLSAKRSLPAQLCRKGFAEGSLSANAVSRGNRPGG